MDNHRAKGMKFGSRGYLYNMCCNVQDHFVVVQCMYNVSKNM